MTSIAAISGGNGFIGRHLTTYLTEKGFEVLNISRDALSKPDSDLDERLRGVSVVIHLSGAPVVGRWTASYQQTIYNSRILTTRRLVDAMEIMEQKPRVFICASAVGIYPESGIHTEDETRIDTGFLGEVVRDWEQEAMRAASFVRTMTFRFGMVLGRDGGALKTMELPFRAGLGGRIGSGKQMMSWIHIDDLCRAVDHLMSKNNLFGPVNLTTPHPVSNAMFTTMLARELRRPALFPIPAFALRLLYGEGATVLTRGQAVLPKKLQQSGFQFRHPHLEEALKELYSSKK